MPRSKGRLRAERRLLADFAEQAGVAFRNTLLQTELTARVQEIDARPRDLEQSRRRLVHAEDTERERLGTGIEGRVVTHLTPVIESIGGGLDTTTPGLADELDRLIGHTETAVDELRAVSHGVLPALLHRRGLVAALSAELDATHRLTDLEVDASADRHLDPAVEAATYCSAPTSPPPTPRAVCTCTSTPAAWSPPSPATPRHTGSRSRNSPGMGSTPPTVSRPWTAPSCSAPHHPGRSASKQSSRCPNPHDPTRRLTAPLAGLGNAPTPLN